MISINFAFELHYKNISSLAKMYSRPSFPYNVCYTSLAIYINILLLFSGLNYKMYSTFPVVCCV